MRHKMVFKHVNSSSFQFALAYENKQWQKVSYFTNVLGNKLTSVTKW